MDKQLKKYMRGESWLTHPINAENAQKYWVQLQIDKSYGVNNGSRQETACSMPDWFLYYEFDIGKKLEVWFSPKQFPQLEAYDRSYKPSYFSRMMGIDLKYNPELETDPIEHNPKPYFTEEQRQFITKKYSFSKIKNMSDEEYEELLGGNKKRIEKEKINLDRAKIKKGILSDQQYAYVNPEIKSVNKEISLTDHLGYVGIINSTSTKSKWYEVEDFNSENDDETLVIHINREKCESNNIEENRAEMDFSTGEEQISQAQMIENYTFNLINKYPTGYSCGVILDEKENDWYSYFEPIRKALFTKMTSRIRFYKGYKDEQEMIKKEMFLECGDGSKFKQYYAKTHGKEMNEQAFKSKVKRVKYFMKKKLVNILLSRFEDKNVMIPFKYFYQMGNGLPQFLQKFISGLKKTLLKEGAFGDALGEQLCILSRGLRIKEGKLELCSKRIRPDNNNKAHLHKLSLLFGIPKDFICGYAYWHESRIPVVYGIDPYVARLKIKKHMARFKKLEKMLQPLQNPMHQINPIQIPFEMLEFPASKNIRRIQNFLSNVISKFQ
jgi:hypothetical protein